jgi:hypothetical protein
LANEKQLEESNLFRLKKCLGTSRRTMKKASSLPKVVAFEALYIYRGEKDFRLSRLG